jgi:intracellular sulfur oxidation DsrE/DsrF family protein
MLRRSFFARAGSLAAVLGYAPVDSAQGRPDGKAEAAGGWQPARHDLDNWFELPGKHRVLFDTWTASRFPDVLRFAGNIYRANRDAYNLTEREHAVVIVCRHETAPFAFNDAMWAKYGQAFSKRMGWVDPKTNEPPTTNIHTRQMSNFIQQGVHLAVCSLTTRSLSQTVADETKRTADEVYKELTSNTHGNAHFVPAGVLAATRAQERGYSIISIG